jgi:uncharacterized protein YxeA
MKNIIIHLLILLVLVTHSVMAVDVYISHDIDNSMNFVMDTTAIAEQAICDDSDCHYSCYHAHSVSFISSHNVPDTLTRSILLPIVKTSIFIHTQAPPHRPPKV